MRKLLTWIVCAVLLLAVSVDAKGKKKKKPKPPKTLIAKCGELVLEDDFDEKELKDWAVSQGKAMCANGLLVLTAESGTVGNVNHSLGVEDFVVEMVAQLRKGDSFVFAATDQQRQARVNVNILKGAVHLAGGKKPPGSSYPPKLAEKPYSGSTKAPIHIVFEKVGTDMLVRLGRCVVSAENPDLPSGDKTALFIACFHEGAILAIDYIRIWKAEPKKRRKR